MWIRFIKDFEIFKAGEKADVTRAKAAELRAGGYISSDIETPWYGPEPEAVRVKPKKKAGRPRKK
jgi:hypothetical protein